MTRRSRQSSVLPKLRPGREAGPESTPDDGDAELAAWLGERLRRVALGLTGALVTARAYWPSEPDLKADAGTGLDWDLALLLVAGLAVAAALIGGSLRVRRSWTDAAVVALTLLVGVSAGRAYDRRVAINLAWDWGAVGIAYVLVRNLPRTRGESTALAGALTATAVAVSVYGLYQAGIEMPQNRAYYRTHRTEVLSMLGYSPGSTAARMYDKRLLDSTEPISTFALTNSLAGFLVGPLVLGLAVGWENLVRRDGPASRWGSLAAAVPPLLAVLVCLILTKSRSAYVGLAVALAVLAWRERRRVPGRVLAWTGLGGVLVLGLLVAAGLSSRWLDRGVLTQTTKSLRYRAEYWVGAWRVIAEKPYNVFWGGHGPGNFTALYLRHKLPGSSEEIFDPHNMILEVWSTAGVFAMLALVAGLGLAFWNLLRPAPGDDDRAPDDAVEGKARHEPDAPPRRPGWLLVCAGGGWVAAVLLGHLNPFVGDLLERWLVLGAAWLGAAVLGLQLWRRVALRPLAFGAAALAMAVNLLAAGGIGQSSVALMLWLLIALGLNLSEPRGPGRVHTGGRLPAFALALVWAALIGVFAAAIGPFWESESAMADAEAALQARPPQFDRAEAAFHRAIRAEDYSARPWFGLAFEKYEEWRSRGSKPDDLRWKTIPINLVKAVEPPRNPYSWNLHHERAKVMQQLLAIVGKDLMPRDRATYQANIVEALRRASRLYPSNATLHAELADASVEIGMYSDAVKEAREALRYDRLTPHEDKKLAPRVRTHLVDDLPRWEKSAGGKDLPTEPPKGKGKAKGKAGAGGPRRR